MSLRKSPQLTPELLTAARQNGQRSAGPRSEAGKQNSKMNALKHGQRASPENHRLVMLALGEDPEEFDNLKQDLMLTYGPGDPLWQKQIDDLARLYWRRQRLERAQEGLMRRALLAVEEGPHRRRQEIAGATFGPSPPRMLDVPMSDSADPGVRLKKLLSFLEVIREQARQRTFCPRQYFVLETLYQGMMGWRAGRVCRLLHLFADPAALSERKEPENEGPRKMASDASGPLEEAGEPQYQELLRLLEEESAQVREEFDYAEKLNEEKAAVEREAALAAVGEAWTSMARQQAALDRSIDRKVRILLALRKEFTRLHLPAPPPDEAGDAEMEEINKVLGIDIPPLTPPTEEPAQSKTEQTTREYP